ncbi:MAG: DNA polymerase III subunit delta' [Bacillota bacterium]
MSFQDIIGQETVVQILKEELDSDRINHAYLFSGKYGIGKKSLAVEFTKAILCRDDSIDACEQCLVCRKINHSNHPDVQIVAIEEEGDSIKIEQIREMQRDMAYRPYESNNKIYIIEDADKMTTEAANSLLKTLEEPPEYGVIILLAEEINKLLPTVISRCQQLALSNLSSDEIEKELLKRDYKADKVSLILKLADGSLGYALDMLNNEDFLDNRKKILDKLHELPDLNSVQIFKMVDFIMDILKNNSKFPLFYLILSWYRDIMLYNQGCKESLINNDYLQGIKEGNNYYSLEELISIVELVNNIKRYINRNVKKDLALQVLFLKIRAKKVK